MRIACLQTTPIRPADGDGMARLAATVAKAAAQGADLLVTPEMFLTGYNIGAPLVEGLAQPADGVWAGQIAGLARDHRVAVAYGYPERGADGTIYNAAQLIDEHGVPVLNYRKTHLYGAVDRTQFAPGTARSSVVDWRGWKLALSICYDVEFPELIRAAALDGADLILTPTANMVPYDSVATRLVPARAEENGVFMVYANYVGAEGAFSYCGKSCVCSPGGDDLARASQAETLLIADLDHDLINKTRSDVTYLRDRRPDI
ncbi:carbon-nitrogen hydrolase family protein [Pseudorhodobacter sp.]|uniref:carbon-nitrogen hydrolase family protein n=1 Tax=Pseudorhodobacter sp. TaxID=1934400 RepID=UPI002647F7A1|nr:carbon-nitrogen hydrolase family protein [Pseudorhodobacter sp.]MDN5789201.1 carbon-nitrogen hydrolase family protein [Pseudorhodobacter sp.]